MKILKSRSHGLIFSDGADGSEENVSCWRLETKMIRQKLLFLDSQFVEEPTSACMSWHDRSILLGVVTRIARVLQACQVAFTINKIRVTKNDGETK